MNCVEPCRTLAATGTKFNAAQCDTFDASPAARLPARPTCRRCPRGNPKLIAEHHSYQVQQYADAATDQGAIETDELEVLADLELDLFRYVLRVPAFHDIGDEQQDLVPLTQHPRLQPPQAPFF